MKKRSLIMLLILALAAMMTLAACGGGSGDTDSQSSAGQEEASEDGAADSADALEDSDEEAIDPAAIIIDKENRSVTVTAKVNGKFFKKSTMHYVVNKDGGVGKKAMLAAYADPQDFYDAMVSIGGTPWNTTDAKIADGEFTDGEKVSVTLTWEGQETPVPMADTLKTDDGRPEVDMRFSGNQQNNAECGSGCIACLNSCWAGITSNAAYGFDEIDSGKLHTYLDDSVMPADGTDVQVTFTLE